MAAFQNLAAIYFTLLICSISCSCGLCFQVTVSQTFRNISNVGTTAQKRAIPKDAMTVDLNKELFYTQFSRNILIFSYLYCGIHFLVSGYFRTTQ